MSESHDSSAKFENLRQQAEALIQKRPDSHDESSSNFLDLLHEFKVHQTELEIQNEELRKAQNELSSLHYEYENLYEFAPCGYLTLNPKGIITRANLTAVSLLYTDKSSLYRSALSSHIATGWETTFLNTRREASQTGQRQSVELPLKTGKESPRWVRANIQADYDKEGAVFQWRIVLDDITERKQTEEALKDKEERLSLALDGGNLGTWDWNIQTDEVDFDERWTAMKGYSRSEIQPHLEAWKKLLHPDDRNGVMEKLQAHLQGKTDTYEAEFRMLGKNGEWLWISDRGKVLQWDEMGNPLRACGIHLDITEKKRADEALRESEEKYRQLAETTSDIIVIHDLNGRILFTNQAGRDFYGLQHSEIVGASVFDFIPPEYHADILSRKNQRRLGDAGMQLYEIEFMNNAGQRVPIEINSTSFLHDGKEQRILIVARDIQKRKQMEAQLQQAQKMEAIGTLAGGIAHDFNNILYPLMGFTEMLKEDVPSNSPLHNHIDEILQASFRARDLVKQILAFSRQGEQELKPIKLQPIIKEALKLLRSSIPTTIDILQDIDPECGVVVADPTQIHQIIMNLATNAFHAMEEKGGSLTVSLEQVRLEPEQILLPELAPGDYARLRVVDTGPGIEKEHLDKIFDPYFTTKGTGKGTGLGLSVVQGIVKRAHGDILINSEPGQGTEIQVYLPVKQKISAEKQIDPHQPVRGGTEKILLVDDEASIVKMEQQMLERLGYTVTVRTSSLEALEAFKADPQAFDVVVTDMTMPNMTGVQLAAELKKIRLNIPVVLCTGFSYQVNDEKSKALGIDGFVMKPVIMKEIAATIRKVLDNRKD